MNVLVILTSVSIALGEGEPVAHGPCATDSVAARKVTPHAPFRTTTPHPMTCPWSPYERKMLASSYLIRSCIAWIGVAMILRCFCRQRPSAWAALPAWAMRAGYVTDLGRGPRGCSSAGSFGAPGGPAAADRTGCLSNCRRPGSGMIPIKAVACPAQ